MKNEVRLIDANALVRNIREYMDSFPNATTRLATCRVILSMLGDEGKTPTITAHIDKGAWEECTYCSGIPHMEGVELKPCASGNIGCEVAFGKCRDDESVGMVVYHRNTAGGYVDFDFCPFCGKPQTEEAWVMLEKRLRG